ncbi:MAG: hypothetical protein KGJ60_04560 [Verrucomicrobiota bacterium]|nr:hypothetical protein [Verrucomicrobiota bacterium]
MKAVIIYDQFDFAAKAKAMLERASDRAGDAVLWNVMPWRVDMLNLAPAAAEALMEAADAHLIVLSVRQPGHLPIWLMDWLEVWAERRRVPDAALATFGGARGGALSATAAPELSRFAERHRLSFIFSDRGPGADDRPE